jgi:hypothetical protein
MPAPAGIRVPTEDHLIVCWRGSDVIKQPSPSPGRGGSFREMWPYIPDNG